jgi:hypothetical protein
MDPTPSTKDDNDSEVPDNADEDANPASSSGMSNASLYPKKHLEELPIDEINALKIGLERFADRLKFRKDGEGGGGRITPEILTRITLSRESLLAGVKWLVSNVEQVEDADLKSAITGDSDLWKAVLKIALRDKMLRCSVSDPDDPVVPSWKEIRAFLFFTVKGRRGLKIHRHDFWFDESRNATGDEEKEEDAVKGGGDYGIDENNGYFYYLKQLIAIHKDKMAGEGIKEYYELDASHLYPPNIDKPYVPRDEIGNIPVWSHLDVHSDGFVGSCSNVGIKPDGTVIVASKGRYFERFDGSYKANREGCSGGLVLPMEADLIHAAPERIGTTVVYDVGTAASSEKYERAWKWCIAPASCKRHVKERLESSKHSYAWKWFDEDVEIDVKDETLEYEGRTKSTPNRRANGDPCSEPSERFSKKSMLDAVYDECALESKKAVAHLSLMKNGDVLCILEDNPARTVNKATACKPGCESERESEKLGDRKFSVLWYRLDRKKKCRCTFVGRFAFSDFSETRSFDPYRGGTKEGGGFAVNVKRYVSEPRKREASRGPATPGRKVQLINRIVESATWHSNWVGSGGSVLTFAMLVDEVKVVPGREKLGKPQDSLWSMTFFVDEESSVPGSLDVKGCVATLLNKEHVWGRSKNWKGVAKASIGVTKGRKPGTMRPLETEENRYEKRVSRRGFYDLDNYRLNVFAIPESVDKMSCASYSVFLANVSSSRPGETLVFDWSESTEGIELADENALVSSNSDRPIDHDDFLTCHGILGPFSKECPTVLVGHTMRASSAGELDERRSVVVMHRGGAGTTKSSREFNDLKTLVSFDQWMPTNMFEIVRKPYGGPFGEEGAGGSEINFHCDASWVYEDLLVGLSHHPGDPNDVCAKIFRIKTDNSFGTVPSTSKNGEDYRDFYLLNSSKLPGKAPVDIEEYFAYKKQSKLGDVFETKDHVVLVIKEDVKHAKLRGKRTETSSDYGDKLPKTMSRLYFKTYKSAWIRRSDSSSSAAAADDNDNDNAPSSEPNEIVPTDETAEVPGTPGNDETVASRLGAVANDIFYAANDVTVCTNPSCNATTCKAYENNGALPIKWYFCDAQCHGAFYDVYGSQMK